MTDEPKRTRKSVVAGLGLIVGLVALATAFLSPNIAEVIDPPAPPIEEVAVDLASKIIDAAKAKATGEEYQPVVMHQQLPSRYIYPFVVCLGMLAAALGVTALIQSEDRTMAGVAIVFGIGAVIVQWTMMMIGAILLILLVIAVIGFLTGGSI